jgi:hypothetical protein
MNEQKQESKSRNPVRLDLSSKFWKTFLIVLAVFLTFAGPTYVVYALLKVIKMNYFVSMASGFALFTIGLVLIWYLIKRKIIS